MKAAKPFSLLTFLLTKHALFRGNYSMPTQRKSAVPFLCNIIFDTFLLKSREYDADFDILVRQMSTNPKREQSVMLH